MLHIHTTGINVEDYRTCTKSEYHVEARTVQLDLVGPVVLYYVLNALNVVVTKKNNSLAAYQWVLEHTNV